MQTPVLAALLAAVGLIAPAALAHGPSHAEPPVAPPAPVIALPDPDAAWQLGDLTLRAAYARATLPDAPMGGAFVTIVNDGDAPDRLIAADSPAAGQIRMIARRDRGAAMTLRPLPDGMEIPAGASVTLEPAGDHLALMRLAAPLTEGDRIDLTLTFARAGQVTLPLSVQPAHARPAGDAPGAADPHANH